MRRCVAVWAALLFLFSVALGEETPRFTADVRTAFHMRKEADSEYRVGEVKKGQTVDVYEVGPEWSKVGDGKVVGYGRTEWLWRFISLDATQDTVPGAIAPLGFVRLKEDTLIQSKDFGGVLAPKGSLIAVSDYAPGGYEIPIYRTFSTLPDRAGTPEPFLPWNEAKPGEMIGGFTTYYNEATGGKLAEKRRENIRIGIDRIQKTRVKSGETFSFNALCGPYTKKNGYVNAPNISSDGVGYGGGVCQVSTTLYNAILPMPLQIDEWRVHRDSGIPYAPVAFDAAVGKYSDLAFVNKLPYPIEITAQDTGGVVTVIIRRAGK